MQFLFDRENAVVIIVGGIRPAASTARGLPALARGGTARACAAEALFGNIAWVLFAMNLEWLELEAAYLRKTAFFPCKASLNGFYPTSLRSCWCGMASLTFFFLKCEVYGLGSASGL